MKLCGRCDWQPSEEAQAKPKDQLAAHASDSGHGLCSCCEHSLTDTDPRLACEGCLTKARSDLAAIVTLTDELTSHLGVLRGLALDGARGGSDGRPLPGGEILTLLAGGSHGGEPRLLTSKEKVAPERWWLFEAIGPLSLSGLLQVERARTGREHAADNLDTDAPSVAWALRTWEVDWRDERNDPDSSPARSTTRQLAKASAYLEVHARWAANQHGAFDEFCSEMHDLHTRLERATGRLRLPSRAGADCFDCGGRLIRRVVDGLEESYTDSTGNEVPVWTCQLCETTYDPARYNLALAAHVQSASRRVEAGEVFETVALVAATVGRPEVTVRRWHRLELVRSRLVGGVLFVSLADALRESAARTVGKGGDRRAAG